MKSKNSAKTKAPTKKNNETKFVELFFRFGHNNCEFKPKNCEKQFYCFLARF